jgi:hypothetical protein
MNHLQEPMISIAERVQPLALPLRGAFFFAPKPLFDFPPTICYLSGTTIRQYHLASGVDTIYHECQAASGFGDPSTLHLVHNLDRTRFLVFLSFSGAEACTRRYTYALDVLKTLSNSPTLMMVGCLPLNSSSVSASSSFSLFFFFFFAFMLCDRFVRNGAEHNKPGRDAIFLGTEEQNYLILSETGSRMRLFGGGVSTANLDLPQPMCRLFSHFSPHALLFFDSQRRRLLLSRSAPTSLSPNTSVVGETATATGGDELDVQKLLPDENRFLELSCNESVCQVTWRIFDSDSTSSLKVYSSPTRCYPSCGNSA